MALSIQAICGAIIGTVVFSIGVATWLRDRRNDNAPGAALRVSASIDNRPAVHM